MSISGAIVTAVTVWWLIFFMVLPFGAALATCAIAWFLDSGLVDLRPH